MNSYSLLTEPWIPVQTLAGQAIKVSLPQALTQAHQLRGIMDPSPLITVALHRLLLALIYSTHPLHRFEEWKAIWQAGRFDEAAIAAYGQRWAARFDLLHPTHPFYQVPYMPDEKVHPVAALVLEAASGNNPTLFDHGLVEGAAEMPLDRAACYLLAHQWFAVGGGVSKPFNRMDAPLAKGLVVEVVGRTLFETLALNAMPLDQWRDLAPATRDDRPFWEEDAPPEPVKEGTAVRGPLQYLTWQSRRIHLVVDRNRGVVTGCQIAQRYCLPRDGSRFDPGKCYFRDQKKESGWQPRRLQKDRAAWRLTHVLLQSTEDRHFQPKVLHWLGALRLRAATGSIDLPQAVSLSVSGLTTDPNQAAKIDLWRREEIGLPTAIVDDPTLVRRVTDLMADAGRVEAHLRRSAEALVWALAERAHQRMAVQYLWTGQTGAGEMPPTVAPVARGLGVTARFWAAMEAPFRKALWEVPGGDPAAVQAAWRQTLKQHAWQAFHSALDFLKGTGAPWEPLSLVEDAFARRLHWILSGGKEESDDDSDEE